MKTYSKMILKLEIELPIRMTARSCAHYVSLMEENAKMQEGSGKIIDVELVGESESENE